MNWKILSIILLFLGIMIGFIVMFSSFYLWLWFILITEIPIWILLIYIGIKYPKTIFPFKGRWRYMLNLTSGKALFLYIMFYIGLGLSILSIFIK